MQWSSTFEEPSISCIVLSNALKYHLLFIGVSSQTINEVVFISFDRCVIFLISQVELSSIFSGILNLEWVVLPPSNSNETILDEKRMMLAKSCLDCEDEAVKMVSYSSYYGIHLYHKEKEVGNATL
ncbi:hypothetical protein BDE02_01G284200 [Populus trichocarpa]|nr:hypothetical protein BDE02_01G284200 [Populus trichocarpa]